MNGKGYFISIIISFILISILIIIFLSFSNTLKVKIKWLASGNHVTKEEVERAIKEQHEEK